MFGVMFFVLKNSFYILYSGSNVNPIKYICCKSTNIQYRNRIGSKTIEMWMDMLCGRERRVGVLCGAEISMGGANSVGWIPKGMTTLSRTHKLFINK